MKVYWLDRESIAVAETSDGKNFTSPDEVKVVTIFCTKEDEVFEADDATDTGIGMLESPVLADEFHEALAYKVIQQGYERKPDQLVLAQYFKAQFEEMVREAKKSANNDFDGSSIEVMGHDY
jgi:hypothetical protein